MDELASGRRIKAARAVATSKPSDITGSDVRAAAGVATHLASQGGRPLSALDFDQVRSVQPPVLSAREVAKSGKKPKGLGDTVGKRVPAGAKTVPWEHSVVVEPRVPGQVFRTPSQAAANMGLVFRTGDPIDDLISRRINRVAVDTSIKGETAGKLVKFAKAANPVRLFLTAKAMNTSLQESFKPLAPSTQLQIAQDNRALKQAIVNADDLGLKGGDALDHITKELADTAKNFDSTRANVDIAKTADGGGEVVLRRSADAPERVIAKSAAESTGKVVVRGAAKALPVVGTVFDGAELIREINSGDTKGSVLAAADLLWGLTPFAIATDLGGLVYTLSTGEEYDGLAQAVFGDEDPDKPDNKGGF